ncbi:MAG: hypothetical protein K0S23_1920 [Fluviicola sp.]|jgi:hypothetical protein|uniref:KAP family P-loop NTPase fold protein n=1 Tax=Fluviicola sp. TaxID=1917219 RepID=UPI002603D1AC|nr:P-loop NTPase fold protein [Fluviicola sp.]MDF3027613.1 hypothetical protein [Fluviicola sp.]
MTRITAVETPKENPFLNCKLAREPYAKVLTDIVRTNSDGFVLAIDNKWGAGKTTFISMWKQHLENEEFQTLYFNAWENDFENNPFIALTAELKVLLKSESSDTFKEILKKGSKIAQATIPSIIKSVVKKYAGEDAAEIMESYSQGVLEAFKEDIDSYIDRKQTMSDFRNELQNYIEENSNGKPIVFIIDELDRCRPNYAVAILENVKHLFSVKGIVFVLSIDKEQLGHAICGAYGSDKIDANEYLRRFIDVEYSLPEPEIEEYIIHLIDLCGLNSFFNLGKRKHDVLARDTKMFIEYAKFIFELKNLTLRQQEKILSHTGVVLRSFLENAFIIPELLVYLVYLKLFYNNLYTQIRRRELTHQQLIDKCAEVLKGDLVKNNRYYFRINIEAMLLTCYNEYLDYEEKIKVNDNEPLNIKSYFDTSEDQSTFKNCIKQELNNYQRSRTPIDYLLKKIDLVEPLKDFDRL